MQTVYGLKEMDGRHRWRERVPYLEEEFVRGSPQEPQIILLYIGWHFFAKSNVKFPNDEGCPFYKYDVGLCGPAILYMTSTAKCTAPKSQSKNCEKAESHVIVFEFLIEGTLENQKMFLYFGNLDW